MLFALLLRGKLHRSIVSLFLYGLPGWMQASFARRRRPRAPLKIASMWVQSDSRAVGNLDDPTDNENVRRLFARPHASLPLRDRACNPRARRMRRDP